MQVLVEGTATATETRSYGKKRERDLGGGHSPRNGGMCFTIGGIGHINWATMAVRHRGRVPRGLSTTKLVCFSTRDVLAVTCSDFVVPSTHDSA